MGTTPDLGVPLDGLLYEITDGIAVITLNRPERGNAMNPAMSRALHAAWVNVRENPEVKVAVLTGAGTRHFCTGADVTAVAEAGRVFRRPWPDDRGDLRLGLEQPGLEAGDLRGQRPGGAACQHLVAESDIVIAVEGGGATRLPRRQRGHGGGLRGGGPGPAAPAGSGAAAVALRQVLPDDRAARLRAGPGGRADQRGLAGGPRRRDGPSGCSRTRPRRWPSPNRCCGRRSRWATGRGPRMRGR